MTYQSRWREPIFKLANDTFNLDNEDFTQLQNFTKHSDFNSIIESICTRQQHPFDEISYIFNLGDACIFMDFINNANPPHVSEVRIVNGSRHIGNVEYHVSDGTLFNISLHVKPFKRKDTHLLTQLGTMALLINNSIGYALLKTSVVYTTSDDRKMVESKIEKPKNKLVANHKSLLSRIKILAETSYNISNFAGTRRPPSHEFSVRGHIRRYKNGKEVFIKPYIKCKGRGERLHHSFSYEHISELK